MVCIVGGPMDDKDVLRSSKKWVNAAEAGFPAPFLIRLNAAIRRIKHEPARFMTWRATGDLARSAAESVLPKDLVEEGREIADALGVRSVYIPKKVKHGPLVVDVDAVRTMRAEGVSLATIRAVFGARRGKTIDDFFQSLEDPITPRKQIRKVSDEDAAVFKTGFDWLAQWAGATTKREKQAVIEEHGPGLVARVGEAVEIVRKKLGRDPERTE